MKIPPRQLEETGGARAIPGREGEQVKMGTANGKEGGPRLLDSYRASAEFAQAFILQ